MSQARAHRGGPKPSLPGLRIPSGSTASLIACRYGHASPYCSRMKRPELHAYTMVLVDHSALSKRSPHRRVPQSVVESKRFQRVIRGWWT